MSKLLVITDHRFYLYEGDYYDNYVFNYEFFKSYLEIFDEVKLLVRVKAIKSLRSNMQLASGPNVEFIELRDFRRFELLFKIGKELKSHNEVIQNADAICFRLPSTISNSVFRYITSRKKVPPYMFELIGDPEESLNSPNDNFFISKIKNRLSKDAKFKTREIVNNAVCGSYVSFNHLQKKYPADNEALTASISSIRLNSKYVLSRIEGKLDLTRLKIIHVGSFVEVKNQQFLVELAYSLILKNYDVSLTFIGDGILIDSVKTIVKKLKLENIVTFKGQVIGFDKIVDQLDSSNIFILPSLTEGMPRAMIEAMSRGLLCLGANRGGIAELLPEANLFDPNTVQSALEKLLYLLDNPSLIETSRTENLKLSSSFEFSILQQKRKELLGFLKTHIRKI